MQEFIIYDSGKNHKWAIGFCLVMMAGLVYILFKIELSLVTKLIAFVIIGIFAAIAVHFYNKLQDTRPLYIINYEGIYARRYEKLIPWSDLNYFEVHVIRSDAETLREFRCFNASGVQIVTIDLLDSDIHPDVVEKILNKKLDRKNTIPE